MERCKFFLGMLTFRHWLIKQMQLLVHANYFIYIIIKLICICATSIDNRTDMLKQLKKRGEAIAEPCAIGRDEREAHRRALVGIEQYEQRI